jgi:hypothetical protein
MIDLDDLYGPMEVDGDLSITLGTETRTERDMVSLSFDNTPGSSVDTLIYSFYACNARGVRESLQQCKEANHTRE